MNPSDGGVGGEYFFWQLLHKDCFHSFRELFAPLPIRSVLDIGCNDCRALIGMHYQCGSTILHGFDIQPKETFEGAYEAIARKLYGMIDGKGDIRPRLRVLLGAVEYGKSIEQYPMAEAYDAIICSHVLHYMKSEEEVQRVLDRVMHHLRPGGMVYLSVKDGYRLQDPEAIRGEELLALCHSWAKTMELDYLPSHTASDQGQAHVFTNLSKRSR